MTMPYKHQEAERWGKADDKKLAALLRSGKLNLRDINKHTIHMANSPLFFISIFEGPLSSKNILY